MIEIKACTIEDLKELQNISRQTFKETFDDTNTQEDMKEYLDEAYNDDILSMELNNPDSRFYFLYKDNEIAAYLKLNLNGNTLDYNQDNSMELQRIYVLNKFQRQGFGKKLYEKTLDVAKQMGRSSICLGVWEYNYGAQKFYKSMGFDKVGAHNFQLGTQAQTDFIFAKRI